MIRNKKLIAWGAGFAFETYMKTHEKMIFDIVIDNNSKYYDTGVVGISVNSPNILDNIKKDEVFVVIFTLSLTSCKEVSKQLKSLGLRRSQYIHYCDFVKDEFIKRCVRVDIEMSKNNYRIVKSLMTNSSVENQTTFLGSWLFIELLKFTEKSQGDIVELGVYKGGNAFVASIFKYFRNDMRKYYLMDSFEGLPTRSKFDPENIAYEFKDCVFENVVDVFKDFTDVRIIRGWIPESFGSLPEGNQYSLVYYDCDLYQPAIASFEYF